jgi:hypothetical protein
LTLKEIQELVEKSMSSERALNNIAVQKKREESIMYSNLAIRRDGAIEAQSSKSD